MKRKIHNVQIIILIKSKKIYLFEKKDGDEVRKKFWRSKELWKETRKKA